MNWRRFESGESALVPVRHKTNPSSNSQRNTLTVALLFIVAFLVPGTARAGVADDDGVEHRGTEHPGVVHQDDNCSTCHRDKTRGRSVHAAMEVACTVCHLAETQGDMTTLTLSMPKAKICSACHQNSALPKRCFSVAGQSCVNCHDAHSSGRRMLLRATAHIVATRP